MAKRLTPETIQRIKDYPQEITRDQIADELGIDTGTVATYRTSLKEGFKNRFKRRFTEEQIWEIRSSLDNHSECARRYGTVSNFISQIRKGKRYKWVK